MSYRNYAVANGFIVNSDGTGDFTTLASALAAASAGDTVFLASDVTEDVTLPPGINLACWQGSAANTPALIGTLTMTGAGTSTISGIRLATNGAAAIAVTGSAASLLYINNCYLDFSDNSGITFSSSDSGAKIRIIDGRGNLGTTGIACFVHTSAGELSFKNYNISNSGGSTTASTCSSGIINITNSTFSFPITTSSTSALTWDKIVLDTSGFNTTSAILGGSGVHTVRYSRFASGTATAVTCSSATPGFHFCQVASSNANAIDGAGTITYTPFGFFNTSTNVSTSTQTPKSIGPQIYAEGISFDSGTNTLDTYEEGTFTPNLAFTGGSTGITYTTQTGSYTRVGNVVSIFIHITLSSKGTDTGTAQITNMPFNPGTNGSSKVISCPNFSGVTKAGYTSICIRLNNGVIGQFQISSASGSGLIGLTDADISGTVLLKLSGTYLVE